MGSAWEFFLVLVVFFAFLGVSMVVARLGALALDKLERDVMRDRLPDTRPQMTAHHLPSKRGDRG